MDFTNSQEGKEFLKEEESVHIQSIVLVSYCCYDILPQM